jgi:hypothetical protein
MIVDKEAYLKIKNEKPKDNFEKLKDYLIQEKNLLQEILKIRFMKKY